MKVVITSPSLNPEENVSGISSVAQFIISNNKEVEYLHFEVGKKDTENAGMLNRLRRIWRNRVEWKKLLRQHKDAVIHYNMPLMGAAVIRDSLLLHVAHKQKNPVVLHVHGGNYMKNRNRPWLIRKLLEFVFSWSNEILVLSEEEKTILSEDFHLDNVHSLPNCVDLSEARRFQKNVNVDTPLSILYLGRIEKNKGIDYIIEACKKIKNDGIDFILNFAGKEENEGEYLPTLQQSLGDNFMYHGVVYGDVKTELIKECDVFLLPSFFEGLPMSLIETMSFGEIPIVTNVGSIPFLVEDNINGLFIQVKSVDDIVERIKMLINDFELRQRLSSAAQRKVFTLYDDKAYISKLNTLYKKLSL